MELNRVRNIQIFQKAVGDKKKKITFYLSDKPYVSRIHTTANIHEEFNAIYMECIALDSALSTEERIDCILIDSEGHEIAVLAACARRARNKRVRRYSPKITIEIQPDTAKGILASSVIRLNSLIYYFMKT